MIELITDRTQSDISNKTKKGYYNYDDLNRVQEAVKYIYDLLTGYGYSIILSDLPKWSENDTPTSAQMESYRTNISNLRSVVTVLKTTPETPGSMVRLTYEQANDIEKILEDLNTIVESLSMIFIRSGSTLAISGLGYYFPSLYYVLMDSEGINLLDTKGVELKAK